VPCARACSRRRKQICTRKGTFIALNTTSRQLYNWMHRIYLGLCYKRAEVAPLAGGTSFEMKQANKTNKPCLDVVYRLTWRWVVCSSSPGYYHVIRGSVRAYLKWGLDSVGDHLNQEVKSGAVEYVAASEPVEVRSRVIKHVTICECRSYNLS
jgi:hypothetical protein